MKKLTHALLLAACLAAGFLPARQVKAVGTLPLTDALLQAQIAKMPLAQRVGQLFISRTPAASAKALADLRAYHLGGLILFAGDMQNQTPASLRSKLASFQAASSLPLLIATDQEGGTVSRLASSAALHANLTLPSPQALFAQGGLSAVVQNAGSTAALLKSLGINWNFAPVADVAKDKTSFIYPRTFGQNASATSHYIRQVVPAMQNQGIAATLKHFPGYGDAADTHKTFAEVKTPLAKLQKGAMLPFQAGISAGVDSVMVTHIQVDALDRLHPASLSAATAAYLRQQLHFGGVIATDDLQMGAIKAYAKAQAIPSVDVMAVNAGMDALLEDDYQHGIPQIIAAVKAGSISEGTLNAAVFHLLKLKQKLGLLSSSNFVPARIVLNDLLTSTRQAAVFGQVQAGQIAPGSWVSAKIGTQLVAQSRCDAQGNFYFSLPLPKKPSQLTISAGNVTASVGLGKQAALPKPIALPAPGKKPAVKAKTTAVKAAVSLAGQHRWPVTLGASGLLLACGLLVWRGKHPRGRHAGR